MIRALRGAALFFAGAGAILVACGGSEDAASPNSSPDGGSPDDGASRGSDGGGDREGGAPRSGSRLLRVVGGPAGSPDRQLLGLRDKANDLRCTPQRIDGTSFCLPAKVISGEVGLFSDATCATPLVGVATANLAPGDACVTQVIPSTDFSTVLALGAAVDPAAGLFRGPAGSCRDWFASTTQSYFKIAATRPTREYASFLDKVDQLAPNLARSYRVSEDGAVVEGEWFVPTLGGSTATCTPLPSTDGTTRCFPGSPIETVYLDAQCTRAITKTMYTPGNEQQRQPISVGLRYEAGTCPPKAHLYSLGASIRVQQTYAIGTAGACVLQPGGIDYRDYQEVLAEIAPTALPEMTSSTNASGRLTATYHAFGGARSLAYFNDGARSGAPCRFREAADGKLRCLPTDLLNGDRVSTTLYLDAACTTPAAFVTDTQPMCAQNAVALLDRGGCPAKAQWKVYETTPATGTLYQRSTSSSCYAFYGSIARLRRVGAEIPAATFEEGIVEER